MPNYCDYEMKITGSKKAINRVIECLKADYNYGIGKPAHKHFFRVFECYGDDEDFVNEGNGVFSKVVWGYCAWSIHSCMLKGESYSYYNTCKNSHPDIFMGTDLAEQSEDCTIEAFSEEPGIGFSEHYLFKNGVCFIDECVEIEQGGYTKTGKPTKRINWDTYEGDVITFNPNRIGLEMPYAWVS